MEELEQSIKNFVESFGENFPPKTFAVLYAPEKCFLGLVDKNGKVEVKDNLDKFNLNKVYEARIFNAEKELRWLADRKFQILTDEKLTKEKDFAGKIENQKYLLWGQSTNLTNGSWTQFAEARIGAYFLPIKINSANKYAQFTAVEYLKEFEDGNVAVFEERLTGISEV